MKSFTALTAVRRFARAASAAILAGVLLAAQAGAQSPADQPNGPRSLSADDRRTIDQIEIYLNAITTVRSRFLQVATDGSYAEGTFYLDRPGNLRIEYDPPDPMVMVTDGSYLVYHDPELDQITHIDKEDTPAGILLAPEIKLSGEVTVTRVERRPGVVSLGLVYSERPNDGSLTLVFSDAPMALRKWIVVDQRGITTNFSLLAPRFGIELSPDLFVFEAPKSERELDRGMN